MNVLDLPQRLVGEQTQIGHDIAKISERLRIEHLRPQIRDRGIQFFGGFVQTLHKTCRAARHFLEIERRLAFTSAPSVSNGNALVGGTTETYWSPRKPDDSMTKRASW